MIRDYRSDGYVRAVTANVTQPGFAPATIPALRTTLPAGSDPATGFWRFGADLTTTPGRLRVVPFAQAAPGQTFSAQVWGLWGTSEDKDASVLIPHLLCELACVVGDLPGPQLPPGMLLPKQALLDTERLCDQITVTKGWQGTALGLGLDGDLFSLGAGSNVPAVAVLDLRGAQFVSFAFDYLADAAVPMNAFFARA